MRKFNQRGQGMTEYILIIALIAIFVVGGIKFFGSTHKEGSDGPDKTISTTTIQVPNNSNHQ